MRQVKVITITQKAFPSPISNLNRLADKIFDKTGVRPSVRRLAAEILFDGAARRIEEFTDKERLAS